MDAYLGSASLILLRHKESKNIDVPGLLKILLVRERSDISDAQWKRDTSLIKFASLKNLIGRERCLGPPGGLAESTDTSIIDTALREAAEEIKTWQMGDITNKDFDPSTRYLDRYAQFTSLYKRKPKILIFNSWTHAYLILLVNKDDKEIDEIDKCKFKYGDGTEYFGWMALRTLDKHIRSKMNAKSGHKGIISSLFCSDWDLILRAIKNKLQIADPCALDHTFQPNVFSSGPPEISNHGDSSLLSRCPLSEMD